MTHLSLDGKIAFITGSTRGIGWSTAMLFAEHGATVILNGHSDETLLNNRVEYIKEKYGVKVIGLFADFSHPEAIAKCYREIYKNFNGIDIVVNNAGIMTPGLLGMIPDEVIQSSFQLNAIAVIHSMQAAARLMMRKKGGSIINISSILGVHGSAGQVLYSATKAAVIGMTKAAAKELAPHRIRINCIAPGFINTDLIALQSKDVIDSIKMGVIGDPCDVAKAVLFFASSLAEYITGQVLGVDGGMVV